MTPNDRRRISSPSELKALAHPLRVRLYYALSAERAATATRLAQIVSESSALVSYHLRQLAVHGLIEEAEDLVTDQRERWWRPTTQGFSWSPADFEASPESRAVSASLKRLLVNNQLERLQQFELEQPAWGDDWTNAAFASDYLLRLTHSELAALHAELQAVVERWVTPPSSASDAALPEGQLGENAEHVMIVMHGIPFRP